MNKTIFCAIDLETTGLNPHRDQILEIGAALFTMDGVFATFETLVKHDRYEGDPFALQMNAALLKELADGGGVAQCTAIVDLQMWLTAHGAVKPYPVGFNVGPFDLQFLSAANAGGLFHHRAIELGTVFRDLDGVPRTSNSVVKEYLGGDVAHRALQDALDAAELYIGHTNGTLYGSDDEVTSVNIRPRGVAALAECP
jgi:hypothetical protein